MTSKGQPSATKPISDRIGEHRTRTCLMCHGEFRSSWSGERVCGQCKQTTAWQSGAATAEPLS